MKIKKLICKVAAIITLVGVAGIVGFNQVNAQGGEDTDERLEARVIAKSEEGQNYVNLEWTDLNYKDPENNRINDRIHSYKVYQKKSTDPDTAYKAIPVKTDNIRVLNIYPGDEKTRDENYKINGYVEPRRAAGNQLKKWVNELAVVKANKGEIPDKTLKDIVGKESFDKYFLGEENNVSYKYAKDEYGNLITNGRGIVKTVNGQPVKGKDGEYEYIKRPIITVDCVDIRYFRGEEIEDATAEEKEIKYNAEDILKGTYLTDSKVVKKGLDLEPKDEQHKGKYAYDVIYEGGWDGNNGEDLNDASLKSIRDFINTGSGFLQGHNTVNFNFNQQLGDLVGYKMGVEPFGDRRIKVTQNGYLTNFPWRIGDNKETLIVPPSHSCTDFNIGDVWMKYENNTVYKDYGQNELKEYKGLKGTNNFYLSTYNNTASIQTGHSNGLATPDEQKLLINTLCYLAQVGYENKCEDHSAQDFNAPNAPVIESCNADFTRGKVNLGLDDTSDNGTLYDYYVTAKNMSSKESESKEFKIDDIKSVEVKTGLDKYLILCDNNKDTDIKKVTEENVSGVSITRKDKFEGITVSDDRNVEIDITRGNSYIHVAAIDKAGNISETTTKEVTNPYIILDIEKNGDNNTVKNNEEFLADVTLNHIEEGNEDFTIKSFDKLSKEIFTVKYDNTKLQYEGVSNLYEGFRILNVNEGDGEITFKVKDKNLSATPIKKSICTIVFETKEKGQTHLSIENACIIDTDNIENILKSYQCGICNINID